MPQYQFFIARLSLPGVGGVFPNDAAAREHARIVAGELSRNRTKPECVVVFDERNRLVGQVDPD
jgi:uncharacterized protein DUF6894